MYIGFSGEDDILIAMQSIHGKIKLLIVLGLCSALVSFFGLPPESEAWVLFALGVFVALVAWKVHSAVGGDTHHMDNTLS